MKHRLLSLGVALLLLSTPLTTLRAQRLVAITGACIETVSDAGRIENGTILIRDGRIEEIGCEVDIPIAALVIEANGKTILPGIVDPYFVVPISRAVSRAPVRTVVFRGRTFVIGGGPPPIATDFARVIDGLDVAEVDWKPAARSGITTAHLVASGYAQTAVGQLEEPFADKPKISLIDENGFLHLTATNSTKSLDVLRNGLKDSRDGGGKSRGRSPSAKSSMNRERSGGRRGNASSGRPSQNSPGSGDLSQALWKEVKEGDSPLFINVNNAAAVLHCQAILKEQAKARVAFIAAGDNTYLTLDSFNAERQSLILSPTIDLVPNSQNRINVPKLLEKQGINFCFSLSLGQSNFRNQQHTPLFPLAMLVRSGLDRDVALEALTLRPAKLLGLDEQVGSLEVGKAANLIVCDGDPVEITTSIEHVFIGGRRVDGN